jgi:tripartite-type tricarboxylate transporter receptor subunit TctC
MAGRVFRSAAVLATYAVLLVPGSPTQAQSVADFYAGKTVLIYVGFAPGGGYDLYARTLARHMQRYIPGNPSLVVQNMPGAGSMRSANFIYNVAPKDGTAVATFARGIPIDPVMGQAAGVEFEAVKFNWIGSIATEVGICAFMASSNLRTWKDMQTKPSVIGTSGAGSDSHVMPTVLRNMFKLPFKIVAGYSGGGADMVLAMERKEIDGRCGWSWTSLLSQHKRLYDQRQIDIVVQLALEKHDDLPNVPLVLEYANDPRQKAALRLILSRQHIARPFTLPPGVPEDRVAALRAAFDATMKDKDFIAESQKAELEVRPVSGAEMTALIRELYASPPDVAKLATEVVRD